MEILEIALRSFWSFLWVFIILYLVLYFWVNWFLKFSSRLFRMIMVLVRGYPTNPNMDADWDLVFKK